MLNEENSIRSELIKVYATKAEKRAIKSNAEHIGLSSSSYCRTMALKNFVVEIGEKVYTPNYLKSLTPPQPPSVKQGERPDFDEPKVKKKKPSKMVTIAMTGTVSHGDTVRVELMSILKRGMELLKPKGTLDPNTGLKEVWDSRQDNES